MKSKKLLSDALIIAATPLMGYLLLKTYYSGAESNLRLPSNIGSVNIYQSVELGFTILLTLVIIYSASEVLSLIIRPKNGFLIRLRRLVQVSLFMSTCLIVAGLQRSEGDSSALDLIIASFIIVIIVALPFAIRDIIYPYFKYRKIHSFNKRLSAHRKDELFQSPSKYYLSFLTVTNISYLLIPLLIIYTIAYNIGKNSTDHTKAGEYIIIESNPQQIVLINYGDSWITAKYDASYPGMPAYRQEYKIINKDKMSEHKFTVKHIPQLYIYD